MICEICGKPILLRRAEVIDVTYGTDDDGYVYWEEGHPVETVDITSEELVCDCDCCPYVLDDDEKAVLPSANSEE